jgi:hypothetical protein
MNLSGLTKTTNQQEIWANELLRHKLSQMRSNSTNRCAKSGRGAWELTPTNSPVTSVEILLVKVQNLTLAMKITKYLGLLRGVKLLALLAEIKGQG